MRLHRPIGAFLLLWPTLWALWMAAEGPASRGHPRRVRTRGLGHAGGRMRHQRLRGSQARPAGRTDPRPATRRRDSAPRRSARDLRRPRGRRARPRPDPQLAYGRARGSRRGACRGLSVSQASDPPAPGLAWVGIRLGHSNGLRGRHRDGPADRLGVAARQRPLGRGLRHDVRHDGPSGRPPRGLALHRDPVRKPGPGDDRTASGPRPSPRSPRSDGSSTSAHLGTWASRRRPRSDSTSST